MISRLIVASIAYFFSLPGLVMALAMVSEAFRSPHNVFLLVVCWAVTVAIHVLLHITMCFAWILDLRFGKIWALLGAALTIFGFLLYPVFQEIRLVGWYGARQSVAFFLAFAGLFLAPYWCLGGWLFLFHGGKNSGAATTLDPSVGPSSEER
jgi:hypothetical protein